MNGSSAYVEERCLKILMVKPWVKPWVFLNLDLFSPCKFFPYKWWKIVALELLKFGFLRIRSHGIFHHHSRICFYHGIFHNGDDFFKNGMFHHHGIFSMVFFTMIFFYGLYHSRGIPLEENMFWVTSSIRIVASRNSKIYV